MVSVRVVILLMSLYFINVTCLQKQLYVNYKQGFEVHDEKTEKWVASASFQNDFNNTGWTFLEVYTNGLYSDAMQAYAAGVAESVLTRDLISMHFHNTYAGYCIKSSTFCDYLKKFLEDNMAYIEESIKMHAQTSPYWHQVELFYIQLNGMIDGYAGVLGTPRTKIDNVFDLMWILQLSGDLEDLEAALDNPDKERVLGSGSCSALVKILPGYKDIFISQDTWGPYSGMLRVLKKYDFMYHLTSVPDSPLIPGHVMTFSSYPGALTSGDDFYLISSGLVSMETTIGNSNPKLWQYVVPNTVVEAVRSMVANRLALNGRHWSDLFTQYNSGTYNNQWMIIDYNLFEPGQKPPQGLFWVLEQLPGLIVSEDLTKVLTNQTYWGSYNTPYFPKIFEASGEAAAAKKYGDWFTWDKTPRAEIFRRDHVKVQDMDSMLKLMRYNDFTHDPLAACNCTPPYSGENGISARSDLNPANGTYAFSALGHRAHGGIDSKITSYKLFQTLQFLSVAGPTHDDVPAFRWSTSDFKDALPHIGMPDLMVFDPIVHQWDQRDSLKNDKIKMSAKTYENKANLVLE